MIDKVLRKLKTEVDLLIFVATMSIVLSAFMILDSYTVFIDFWQHAMSISSLIRICEFVFAICWLLLSIKFSFAVQRLRKRHFQILYVRVLHPIWEARDEQKKGEVIEIARDIIAFYRTYYREVKVILTLAIATSFLIITVSTYSLLYKSLPFWDVFYRWLINVFLLLGVAALYVYIHRSWGKRLLKVKDAEESLSEMLGGPIDA